MFIVAAYPKGRHDPQFFFKNCKNIFWLHPLILFKFLSEGHAGMKLLLSNKAARCTFAYSKSLLNIVVVTFNMQLRIFHTYVCGLAKTQVTEDEK